MTDQTAEKVHVWQSFDFWWWDFASNSSSCNGSPKGPYERLGDAITSAVAHVGTRGKAPLLIESGTEPANYSEHRDIWMRQMCSQMSKAFRASRHAK